jgi:hypothetical protein
MFAQEGSWYVVGEIENQGGAPASLPKITVTAYDGANTVVGTDFTFSSIDPLPPNLVVPFSVRLSTQSQPGNYKVDVEGDSSYETPFPENLLFPHVETTATDALGDAQAFGEVTVNGTDPAYHLVVVGEFLNATGAILDTCSDTIEYAAPGALPFKCATIFHSISAASVRVVAGAQTGGGSVLTTQPLAVSQFAYYNTTIGPEVDGILQNDNPGPVILGEARIGLYDATGKVVGVGNAFADAGTIRQGEQAFFNGDLIGESPTAVTARVFASADGTSSVPPAVSLSARGFSNQTQEFGGTHLLGEVVNKGDSAVSSVRVVAAWFDANHHLRAVGVDVVTSTINPGDSAPFDIPWPRDDLSGSTLQMVLDGS